MMGFARTYSVALVGLRGHIVEVEADVSSALPSFVLLGLPDTALNESKERVRSAAKNSGIGLTQHRLTINLTPATLPKKGSGFDVAMVVAALQAEKKLKPSGDCVFLGEVGLDGSIRPIPGILPAVKAAADAGHSRVVVPAQNMHEAALIPGIQVSGFRCLAEIFVALGASAENLKYPPESVREQPTAEIPEHGIPSDMSDVAGQAQGRFALEIAAAGGHHLLFTGPPGSGKTMLAERLPGILPPLDDDAAMEVTAIRSLTAGGTPLRELVRTPPFEAPHHSASAPAILGGGSGIPRPGCVSKAHRGVLFLDEAPEFKRTVLDSLRQPLENGEIVLDRSAASATYPARFQLILAANPCPCGMNVGTGTECTCTPRERRGYFGKLSGPLLDRIDLNLSVPKVSSAELASGERGEASALIRERVMTARSAQRERLSRFGLRVNAEANGKILRGPLRLDAPLTRELNRAVDRGVLTARGYDRVLRTAWTLSDLDGTVSPQREHMELALFLRQQGSGAI